MSIRAGFSTLIPLDNTGIPAALEVLPPLVPLPKSPVILPNYSWRAPVISSTVETAKGSSYVPRMLFYITDLEEAEHLLGTLEGPLGFDVEWKPQFHKGGKESPIALVQLADHNRVMLIHISAMRRQVPKALKAVLEDEFVPKIGVGIAGDRDKVRRDLGIEVRGCVELSKFATAVDATRWKEHKGQLISLARLTESYVERKLVKSKRVQLSNWEMNLTDDMQEYGANDAASALSIYERLLGIRQTLDVLPEPSKYIFNVGPRALAALGGDVQDGDSSINAGSKLAALLDADSGTSIHVTGEGSSKPSKSKRQRRRESDARGPSDNLGSEFSSKNRSARADRRPSKKSRA